MAITSLVMGYYIVLFVKEPKTEGKMNKKEAGKILNKSVYMNGYSCSRILKAISIIYPALLKNEAKLIKNQ